MEPHIIQAQAIATTINSKQARVIFCRMFIVSTLI
jgi:hypothetical protein